ncbi:MAG TPA: carboxypeptidase-like regulatory domain-containing protein, partial [Blastocatellia bacterium]|nr:carboxypeptidase-like regulatory domain-containing protein [Blastocatellia bacterium]
VASIMVRDAAGVRVDGRSIYRSTFTDDRGVYRLHSLEPGTYLVVANGGGQNFSSSVSAYDGETPVYYPGAATRDTAAEVRVMGGNEITGVDIRYLGERGHTVSGRITGGDSGVDRYSANVVLADAGSGATVGAIYVSMQIGANGFAFNGVPDGEYLVMADRRDYDTENVLASAPRRASVRGADVSGIELRLAPLASIAGRVVIEPTPNVCEPKQRIRLEETLLSMPRDERARGESPFPFRFASSGHAPDEKGEFTIRNLNPGQYRLEPQLPGENYFVKSISTPAPSTAGRTAAARGQSASAMPLRSAIPLKSGERITGLTVTIVDGASTLRGAVVPLKEGARLPARLRLHLIPAEATAADDLPRYAETIVGGEGAFSLMNIQPGRYLLLARAVPEDETGDKPVSTIAWDAAERTKIRREAEAAKNEIELKPCQRVKDYVLRW